MCVVGASTQVCVCVLRDCESNETDGVLYSHENVADYANPNAFGSCVIHMLTLVLSNVSCKLLNTVSMLAHLLS